MGYSAQWFCQGIGGSKSAIFSSPPLHPKGCVLSYSPSQGQQGRRIIEMTKGWMTEKEMDSRYAELYEGEIQLPSTDFRDKCKGAIFGCIIGDAMGSVIEFSSKCNHTWINKMTSGGVWGLPKGHYTDDSSMMLCIMQGFLDNPKDYTREIARCFCKWWHDGLWSSTGRCFDIGSCCSSGLSAFERTGSLVNGSTHSMGCGGIMRFAPSWMVEYKVSGDKMSNRRLGAMLDINNIDHYNRECIGAIARIANIFNDHLLDNHKTTEEAMYKRWQDTGSGFDAHSCLENALWAFNITNNFRDAIIACINLGGDADSCGAVCGQIAGSYYGLSRIPKDWLVDLYQFDKINTFVERFMDSTIG